MILRRPSPPRFIIRCMWGKRCLIFRGRCHPHDGYVWSKIAQLQPVAAVFCILVYVAVAELLSAEILHQEHEAGVHDGGAEDIEYLTRKSGPDEIGIDFDIGVKDVGKAQGELPGLADKKGDTDEGEEEELLLFIYLSV